MKVGDMVTNPIPTTEHTSYYARVRKLADERDARQATEAKERQKKTDKPSWLSLRPGAV